MLVAGNWKMHTDLKGALRLAAEVVRLTEAEARTVDVAVCPPSVWLDAVRGKLRGSRVALGAQNVHPEPAGAYTGEVAAPMLAGLDCRYVIVGHSERRQLFGESDAFVGEKVRAVMDAGMTPLLCVGETLDERDAGTAEAVVARQLDGALDGVVLDGAGALVVAYEPVWAIGTGRTATPDQAQAMHAFVRDRLGARFGDAGREVAVLYGGSVKPGNAADLFAQPDLDGGLIGGASLEAESFAAIVRAAAQATADGHG
ncbi:MAG: triose-phosphate isomerase [Rubricoccaceae bacterium]|nr:triose-phosphate isomerase [Rubricoccaceae bacterium]